MSFVDPSCVLSVSNQTALSRVRTAFSGIAARAVTGFLTPLLFFHANKIEDCSDEIKAVHIYGNNLDARSSHAAQLTAHAMVWNRRNANKWLRVAFRRPGILRLIGVAESGNVSRQ